MRTVKIVDFYSIKAFHEVFNLSLVCICAKIADKVTYKLPRGYWQNIASKLSTLKDCDISKVVLKPKPAFERNSKAASFVRHVLGFWICLWEYLTLKRDSLLIFNYTNYFSLPIILVVNRWVKKRVIFTIHGELELLEKDVPIYKVSGIFKRIILASFRHWLHKSNAYVLVLGDSIKKNLTDLFPDIENNIISICHPMINLDRTDWSVKRRGDKLVVGTVGVMNRAKGLDSLIKLSDLLKDDIVAGRLELRCVGRVSGINLSDYPLIKWIGSYDFLSREEFNRNVKELDYVLYLYSDSYKFCASGAILDALMCHRPIISLQNNYFDYILDGTKIGYMLPSVDSVCATIIDLVASNDNAPSFDREFDGLLRKTSVSVISASLELQLIDRGVF